MMKVHFEQYETLTQFYIISHRHMLILLRLLHLKPSFHILIVQLILLADQRINDNKETSMVTDFARVPIDLYNSNELLSVNVVWIKSRTATLLPLPLCTHSQYTALSVVTRITITIGKL